MNKKIKSLLTSLKKNKIDAYLVTKDLNVSYLTSYNSCESWLFVSPKQRYYLTDFRYIEEAKNGLKGVTVTQYKKTIGDAILKIANSLNAKKIGIDSHHVSAYDYRRLKNMLSPKISLVCVDGLVEELREVKTSQETKKTMKAIRIHKKAYDFIKRIIKPAMSERRLLRALENFIKEQNATFAFEPIIASGPNSSLPHAKITDRRIKNGEPVLIDMGIEVDGYKSDLTRVFFLGKIAPHIKNIYIKVLESQQKAIKKIKPNIRAGAIDKEARKCLKRNHLENFFGHSLGHGIGLEVHEEPHISPNSSNSLKEGMVFTVEPGVYFTKKFGLRIEDMVQVTKNGCKVLSSCCGNDPIIIK